MTSSPTWQRRVSLVTLNALPLVIAGFKNVFSIPAPSKPVNLQANTTGDYSVQLRWKKPRELNGIIVMFKVRMLWRFKNVKGDYKYTTRLIPAKVTARAGRRRFRRDMSDYRVLHLEPFREIELKRVQPFAIISIRVSEGTRDSNNAVMWSPLSNNQTIETMEGGNVFMRPFDQQLIIPCSNVNTQSNI